MAFRGFDLGVDFKGGWSYVIAFDQPVETGELSEKMNASLESSTLVKTYGSNNQVEITTAYMIDDNSPETDSLVKAAVLAVIAPFYQTPPASYEAFVSNNIKRAIKVQPTIADDIRSSSIWVTIFASLRYIPLLIDSI